MNVILSDVVVYNKVETLRAGEHIVQAIRCVAFLCC